MRLYKKMVRPYSLEGSWQGVTSAKTPLADWMDEDEKTEALEKKMSQKCKELDRMSSLVWEEKYEKVWNLRRLGADGKWHSMTMDEANAMKGQYIWPAANFTKE